MMADRFTYGQEQAEKNLSSWQGMSGRMRRPSALASPEEREAYVAQEVRAGELPSYMLSEAYGGMPTGTTRRAIRARVAWAQQQEQIAAYNEAMAARERAANDARIFELDYATKVLNLENSQLKNKQDKQDETQIANEVNQLRKIIDSIDPIKDPDAALKIDAAAASFPLGAIQREMEETLTRRKGIAEAYGVVKMQQDAQSQLEEQATIEADVVKYNISPEQRKKMLKKNLPPNVFMYDPNLAKPIIEEAKLAQEAAKEVKAETKTKEKETASKFDEYNKTFAEYEDLVAAGTVALPEDVAKARAKVRGAASVLGLDRVTSEEDLKNYRSGQKVLAPDGITIITVP